MNSGVLNCAKVMMFVAFVIKTMRLRDIGDENIHDFCARFEDLSK
jgi:hypothetical protein